MTDLSRITQDLDRCPHGRHHGDPCTGWKGPNPHDGGCQGGTSLGNPILRPGMHIGYNHYGDPIVVPDYADKHNVKAWYQQH